MKPRAHPRSILLLLAPLLVSCATAPVRTAKAPDLPEAEPDPLAILGIAFPTGVLVKASVITSRDAGMSWRVLACAEHENVVGFVPARDADYVNVYLGQQLSAADPTGESRYLVVELWRYRLAASVKICHRWVIWQDDPEEPPSRADYSVLIEDFQNLVLDHRHADLDASVLERLVGFHAMAVEFFKEHPPAHPDARGPVT
jgi:hypothetical protein